MLSSVMPDMSVIGRSTYASGYGSSSTSGSVRPHGAAAGAGADAGDAGSGSGASGGASGATALLGSGGGGSADAILAKPTPAATNNALTSQRAYHAATGRSASRRQHRARAR